MRIAYLTTGEVSAMLGKKQKSLIQDRWLKRGLPYVKICGGQVLYALADVEDKLSKKGSKTVGRKEDSRQRGHATVIKGITFAGNDDFLTEVQLSAILRRATSTLQKDRFYGRGVPYIKIGQQVRYRVEDLMEYMQAHKVTHE